METQGWLVSGQGCRANRKPLHGGISPARILTILLLAVSLLAAPPASASADSPVAVVGGEAISGDAYLAYLRRYVRSKLYHGGSKERLRELAGEALEGLVTNRLLLQEANRRGIAADDAEVEERIEALRQRYSGGENWPQVEPQLPAIAEKLRTDSKVDALKAEIMEVAAPTDAELTAFHEANPELFTEPGAWDLDLVLVGVPPSALTPEWEEAKMLAGTLVARIRTGEAFGQIAAEHSTHDSADKGGRLGKVHDGQLPGEVQEAIERLSPGKLTDPVRTLEGYAIFRLNAQIPPQTHPLEEVRERAEALYLRNTASARLMTFLEDLRTRMHVETFDVSAYVEMFVSGE